MRVGEALYVAQFRILRRKVVHGVACREVLLVLGRHAVFHIDRERHMGHLPVNLRDPVVLDAVEGLHAVAMDVEAAAQRMVIARFHRETVFSV